MLIVYIIFILLLLILFIQDWESRSVHWLLFPTILLCTIFVNVQAIQEYNINVVFNLLIILIQICVIVIYLKFNNYPWRKLTTDYFPLGDILFLLILAFSFSTQDFLIFNICTIIICLLVAKILDLKTIPFAGIQALMLALFLMFKAIIK